MRSDRYKEEPVKKKKKHSTLKVLLILILLLAAAAAGVTGYSYLKAYNSLAVEFTDENLKVEFGGEYPAMDYVKTSGGEVTPAAAYLDSESTGAKELVYTAAQPVLGGLLTPTKEFTLNYEVTDSVPPVKIWSGDGSLLERGTEFDIRNVIAYGDNADPEPQVETDGKVDMDTSGEYPLHVKVTDASGNATEWDMTVVVVDEFPVYEDTAERTKFKDFVSAYKADGRSFGIDISAWQNEVNFKALKKAGCEFVIMRIGYTDVGKISMDKRFLENYEKAKAAGMKTGVYLYSTDNTEEQVRDSAKWIMETLQGDSLDLPVGFDWEDFGSFQNYKMSIYQLNRLYDAFADELSKGGYGCMLYGSKNYIENIWEKTDTRPVWLAHYTEKTDYKGPYMLWQASCTGRISGIDGDVDMDILYNK